MILRAGAFLELVLCPRTAHGGDLCGSDAVLIPDQLCECGARAAGSIR